MMRQQAQVREFHHAFNHPSSDSPTLPSMELALKRVKWTQEELEEFIEAVEAGDLVSAYDAVIDAAYFVIGTADVLGMDLEYGFDVVHASNMAKLGPDGKAIYGHDGKVVKPEGWEPPEPKLMVLVDQMKRDALLRQVARRLALTGDLREASELLDGKVTTAELAQMSMWAMDIENEPAPEPETDPEPEKDIETEPKDVTG